MKVIGSGDVISIIRKTLGLVDARLIDHGERVAYMMYKIMQTENVLSSNEMRIRCILGIFHDIGAYKTDEINNMLEFETSDVWNHSIYGYLFIKNMSPLSSRADSILYHHLYYKDFKYVECENYETAQLIKLADRIDVFLSLQGGTLNKSNVTNNKGTMFSPKWVDLFIEADEKYRVIDKIKSGEYIEELITILNIEEFTSNEINRYLKMLVYSIDFRSEVTVKHTITTMRISLEIAKVLKLSRQDMYDIYYGALLHDLGKIAIPVNILENIGKLSHNDMIIMKSHVSITEDIISNYINSEICNIAVRHHERPDGSGYPRGLSGDELTLNQRIVAVGDIVSALSGKRSYKNPFSKETIIEILTHMSNENKICSEVTNIYISNYDEIMCNTNKSSDLMLNIYRGIRIEYDYLINKVSAMSN